MLKVLVKICVMRVSTLPPVRTTATWQAARKTRRNLLYSEQIQKLQSRAGEIEFPICRHVVLPDQLADAPTAGSRLCGSRHEHLVCQEGGHRAPSLSLALLHAITFAFALFFALALPLPLPLFALLSPRKVDIVALELPLLLLFLLLLPLPRPLHLPLPPDLAPPLPLPLLLPCSLHPSPR